MTIIDLKNGLSLLERQLIEKISIIDFLVKYQTSPYSNINCDNKILDHESTEIVKNKTLTADNIGKGDRKKVIILGDSLLSGINEKGLSKKHNVKIANKPGATSNPKVKIAFSGLITRKDKKNLDKNVTETNKRLRNYCCQKDIDYIDNSNITKYSLGIKKLHLNRKGNTFFAKNLLKYLNSV